ncbi:hypothetical protein [Rufibacter tibetensis]|uniref:Lipoprotein n=1 Tax=Rufibacter tibetensis TaxID=512763 RepID=A0A0P0C8Q5_9BACT|nr:hypothetical protein [Rufibacter tibetensis]ALI97729.1 hypothetical protein DC20_00380 [Rufibacter tibetensis]
MKVNIVFIALISLFTACVPREITGTDKDQYYAVNNGKLKGTFKIGANDLIIYANAIEFGDKTVFDFESSGKEGGKVVINCKKIVGKKNYVIKGLKANEIEARFKIFIK